MNDAIIMKFMIESQGRLNLIVVHISGYERAHYIIVITGYAHPSTQHYIILPVHVPCTGSIVLCVYTTIMRSLHSYESSIPGGVTLI